MKKSLWSHTLLCHLWQEFKIWKHFKFVIGPLKEVTLEGVSLDVSMMSPIMKNNLLEGRYEVQERQLSHAYLNANDCALEIGGAIGFIGLFCKKNIGIKNYVTVEANPNTLGTLKANYERNGLEPMVWHLAVAGEPGTVKLNIGNEFWENSLLDNGVDATNETVEVEGRTLNQLVEDAPFTVNTLIIDVEGAEQFIDFSQVPDSIEKIIIEVHPEFIGVEKVYKLVSDLIVKGFKVLRQEDQTLYLQRDVSSAAS